MPVYAYTTPIPQHDDLIARALESVLADHYGRPEDPHGDAQQEYSAEQVALAARALVRAVDALPPEAQPIGWVEQQAGVS